MASSVNDMHSSEMLKRLNNARRPARQRLHAKSFEKTGAPLTPKSWTTDEQWEAKMKREGKR